MRTITITKEVGKFAEMPEDVQSKILENLADINIDYDWWDGIYDDAEMVGLKIDSFDIGRGSFCKGSFTDDALNCANLIIENHGESCETFKTAEAFLAERDEAVNTAVRDENGDFEDECELDQKLDDIENDFLYNILEDYRIMLGKEYEYKTSREAIIKTIDCNDYDFDTNGRIA